MVTLALCRKTAQLDASDLESKALRAIGIGTSGISEKETSHRKQYRRKILSRVVPYGIVSDTVPTFPGGVPIERPKDKMEPVLLLTMDLIAPVAEKIVRGLEFKLTGRYIEPPLSLKTYMVPAEKVHELDDIFENTTVLEFGPSLKVLRAIPRDERIIAFYRIITWKTYTIHVSVGRSSD